MRWTPPGFVVAVGEAGAEVAASITARDQSSWSAWQLLVELIPRAGVVPVPQPEASTD